MKRHRLDDRVGHRPPIYRTFWALLDPRDPGRVLAVSDEHPLLELRPALMAGFMELTYLSDVVFTTGLVEDGESYLVASGEVDLACRLTRIRKTEFRRPTFK